MHHQAYIINVTIAYTSMLFRLLTGSGLGEFIMEQ